MKQIKKVFYGVLFIAGAALLIAGSMGYLENFGVWNILSAIVLLSIFVEGLVKLHFGTMVFSVAIFFLINDKWMGMENLPVWPVLAAAALLTIGLHILFPKAGRKYGRFGHFHQNEGCVEYATSENGENVKCEVAFNEAVKYINSQELCNLDTECAFGSLKVYFDKGPLKNGEARVKAESSFGSTIFFVPEEWKVVMDADTAFGSAKESGHGNPQGENILYISADVAFGSIEIKYI